MRVCPIMAILKHLITTLNTSHILLSSSMFDTLNPYAEPRKINLARLLVVIILACVLLADLAYNIYRYIISPPLVRSSVIQDVLYMPSILVHVPNEVLDLSPDRVVTVRVSTNSSSTTAYTTASIDKRFIVTDDTFFASGGQITVIDFHHSVAFTSASFARLDNSNNMWYYPHMLIDVSVSIKGGMTGHDIMSSDILIISSDSRGPNNVPMFDTRSQPNFINVRLGVKTDFALSKKMVTKGQDVKHPYFTLQYMGSSVSLLDNNVIAAQTTYRSNVVIFGTNQPIDADTFEVPLEEYISSFTLIDIVTTTSAALSFLMFVYKILLGDPRMSPTGIIQQYVLAQSMTEYSANIMQHDTNVALDKLYLKDLSKYV
jgi:hypothetical protein